MRIHKVELEGFGPYRGREVVDFDAFEADGIFLMTGRTGAGKTSVLDAITYALFGRVPRYDGAAGEKVRSHHITPTDVCEVCVEFSVSAGRHRVTRRPAYERPKKRGEGTTAVKPFFELAVHRNGEWEVLEAKEGNADRHVSDVLPLTAEQFQQVVLLAQGEFQKFLVADSDERRVLLSRLFDTSRFTAYADDLQERARQLRRGVDDRVTELSTQIDVLCDQVGEERPDDLDVVTGTGAEEWLVEVVSTQDAALTEMLARQTEAQTHFDAAQSALQEGRTLVEKQQRLTRARTRRDQLSVAADDVAAVRESVTLARRAALAWQAVRAVDAAGETERARRTQVVAAESAYESVVGRSAPTGRKAARVVEELTTELGTLVSAQLDETTLPALELARGHAVKAVEDHDTRAAALRDERWKAQGEVSDIVTRLAEVAVVLSETEDVQSRWEAASAGLGAAHDHVTWAERHAVALEDEATALAREQELSQHRRDLIQQQYADYAGVLAHDLVAGEDCPVCGATEHPAKAERALEHVSADQVERAHLDVEEANKRLREASAEATRAATKLADAALRSEGRSVSSWQQDVAEARAAVDRRTKAREDQEVLTGRQPLLDARVAQLSEAIDQAQKDAEVLVSQRALAEQNWKAARERIDRARGDHPTVADRVAAVQRERALVVEVVDARAGLAQADEALGAAHDALQETLAEQRFPSVDEVRDARVDDTRLAHWEERVKKHDGELAAVTQMLAAPELQDVSDDPVDLVTLGEAADVAARTHADVLRHSGEVRNRHVQAKATVGRIRAALASSAQVRNEYGLVNSLAETLRGQGQNERKIALESFALAAELEEIVTAANGRLRRMTDGRYEFRHSDAKAARGAQSGLALDVLDAHTGDARSPRSLSGGEKFQASLALALGLAEVVTARAGGLRLDTLFIDEGFGTLDPETLESTMATLDGLREGGRTVGLISHVTTLKESIPAQLHVEVTAGGWSTLAQV